jgi:hypothetical protein
MRIRDPETGMETVLILNPRWKKSDPASGINIRIHNNVPTCRVVYRTVADAEYIGKGKAYEGRPAVDGGHGAPVRQVTDVPRHPDNRTKCYASQVAKYRAILTLIA